MQTCSQCSTEIPNTSRFCLSCGSAIKPNSATSASTIAISITSSSHPANFDEGRFVPGTLLAERYRILGQLGKGGMGEVYRANDLRLGQTVALKFLPEATAKDPAMLARFYNEVRIARQVTHPNVCRVYDIGDIDGQPFISMQFVDGENLASLLLRIGRLPADKAVEISRRLCAGIAAAHSQGVLHRDLKPANIMIDGRGQVLIADFGLAGIAEDISGADIHSGTPDYMAPEQLAGKEVSMQSDIYALGLVMYEIFTGKRAFEANTLAEMLRLREGSRPADISSTVHDVDPAVERIIQKCLDPDPAKRPSSALAVSGALPGGDPLAAALAAGETPSPEMVAAAGARDGIRPILAAACLAGILVALGVITILHSRQMLVSKVNFELPPDALAVQARKTIQQLGLTEPVADRVWGFNYDGAAFRYLRDHAKRPLDWSALANGQPALIYFSYRESPLPLEPRGFDAPGVITGDDPPPLISGMAHITLYLTGRLRSLSAVPPQLDTSASVQQQPDPAPLFSAAGLDLKSFQSVAPQWSPLAATDTRAAWTGTFAGRPENPIRVEAAWWHAKPVYFQIIGPWTKPDRMPINAGRKNSDYAWLILTIGGVSFAALMAWRNLRMGRGDRQGALRLASFAFVLSFAKFALRAHSASMGFDLISAAIQDSLWAGAQLWLAYIALEPVVRRLWPRTLISWTRVLAGRWRDPLVARDVLIGLLVGLGYDLVFAAGNVLERGPGAVYPTTYLETLLGIQRTASITLNRVSVAWLSRCSFSCCSSYCASYFAKNGWPASPLLFSLS
jgi:ribosomal protein L31